MKILKIYILFFFLGILAYSQELPPTPTSDLDKNWISSISYDLSGNTISKNVDYFNTIGKTTQSQSWVALTNKIWGNMVLYDHQGRMAFKTLNAPLGTSFGLNTSNFILDNTNNSYTASDFDGIYENNPKTVSSTSKLGTFYSYNNTDQYQDITYYPFSRTVYSKLNPGTIKKVLGGNKVNGKWLQTFSFSMPSSQELSMPNAFNNTSYNNRLIFKTINRDVNGIETVTFTDNDGNILANARSGNEENPNQQKYEVFSIIKEQGYVDIHLPIGCTGITITNPTGLSMYIFDLTTENSISYSSHPNLSSGSYRVAVNTDNYIYEENNPITIRYDINYYDYILNIYDKTGRLLQNSQPIDTQIKSTYKYNSLGQLLQASSPDKGEARFVYRKDGQIRFSRNSKQKESKEFSFTNYDALGRPVKSGVYNGLDYNPDTYTNTFNNEYYDWFSEELLEITNNEDGLNNTYTKELHTILYDTPDNKLPEQLSRCSIPDKNYKQTFLYGNVSKTVTDGPKTNITWHSYDVRGRVKWVIQDIEGLDCLKTIDYTYDPATGQIAKIDYQKYSPTERFIHKYNYNNSGQLTNVSTSRNGNDYINHAKYFYNESGALIRTEIAEGLQGIDYVYNLNGQLKAINSPHDSGFTDPGNDGPNTNGFKPDVFGMVIDYHTGDYQRRGKSLNHGLEANSSFNQLNGNIGSIRWNNNTSVPSSTDTYNYKYNKNNWLSKAQFGQSNLEEIQLNGSPTGQYRPIFSEDANKDYEISNLTYDENGNIATLKRNGVTDGNGNNNMDDFTYHYKNGKNQLSAVEDTNDNSNPNRFSDLKNQYTPGTDNYIYNSIGQLETNIQDEINYEYNASGFVTKINGFSQNVTGTWATTYHNDFTNATASDATAWTYDSGIPGININGNYAANRDNRCGYLRTTYGSSLSLSLSGNKKATRNFSVLPNVEHKLSLDVIVKQALPLAPINGDPIQQPVGFHIRLKTTSGAILASTTVNQNLDFITDPDFPNGGPIELGCNYFYDEHVSFDFTTTEEEIEIEIEAITNGVNAQLYADNIHIEAATAPKLAFFYNDRGHRVRKESYQGENTFTTYYVRDVAGNPIAIYDKGDGPTIRQPLVLKELPIYGASRLGVVFNRPNTRDGDQHVYQLTDHLGNVRAVITKFNGNVLNLTSKTDYYPFGMPMPNRNIQGNYRYKFQGQEKDPETGKEAFQLRLWDSRIGRWLTTDPANQYVSPYLGMGNNPINGVDPDGAFWEELSNWLDGKGWNSNAALEFQANGGTLGEWVGDKFTGYRTGSFTPEGGGVGIAVFKAKDDFKSGLLTRMDLFGFEGRVAVGYAGKLSGDLGSNWVKYGFGGSIGFNRMMFIGGDYGFYWNTYVGAEGGHNVGLSLAAAPFEAQAAIEGELIVGVYLGDRKSPNPESLAGPAGSFDLNIDADVLADLSLGAGVTISGKWVLLNVTLGIGLDSTPSVGITGSTRIIGSTLITPVKPTMQRTFSEMIQNHLFSSPF